VVNADGHEEEGRLEEVEQQEVLEEALIALIITN
jgi:hypothetical protein